MTGSRSRGGAIHLMPAPNPLSYPHATPLPENTISSFPGWQIIREVERVHRDETNRNKFHGPETKGTTPHPWCFKVGHSVTHSHPEDKDVGWETVWKFKNSRTLCECLRACYQSTTLLCDSKEQANLLELIQVLDLWVISYKCRIAIKFYDVMRIKPVAQGSFSPHQVQRFCRKILRTGAYSTHG